VAQQKELTLNIHYWSKYT